MAYTWANDDTRSATSREWIRKTGEDVSLISQFLDAAVFDLDGVITRTARVHEAAWKQLFDSFLAKRGSLEGVDRRPFSEQDYHLYVDGRPRNDGVKTFLQSRGVSLPDGHPSDPPSAETVVGLGKRKDSLFRGKLQELGLEVDKDAVRLVRDLKQQGIRVGIASSSKNTTLVLDHAHLSNLFQAQVDGNVSDRLHLPGKPHPDIFLACLHQLGATDPKRAMVVEDATAGVEAGRAGGFRFVLGVNRGNNEAELYRSGADLVINDFEQFSVDRLITLLGRSSIRNGQSDT